MTLRTLNRKDLDEGRCSDPECLEHHKPANGRRIYLNPGCHPGTGYSVHYEKGVLHLECIIYGSPNVNIFVADTSTDPSAN